MRRLTLAVAALAMLGAGCPDTPASPAPDTTAGADVPTGTDGDGDGAAVADLPPGDGGPDATVATDTAVTTDAADVGGTPDVPIVATLPPCGAAPASLVTEAAIQPPDAGSDGWSAPSFGVRKALTDAIALWAAGDVIGARVSATLAQYDVCAEGDLTLWRPPVGSGRAWLLLRAGAARPVVFAAPHPWFEYKVLEQTLGLFADLGARAAVISGTHRCASPDAGTCSGTSSVCTGASEPFRKSDQAHAVDGTFQALHEALLAAFPQDMFVSLHGMSGDGASVSDGLTGAAPAGDTAAKLAEALAGQLPGEYVTSCSTNAAVPQDARLCGTTNAQGRLVNGSSEPCGQAAAAASGRFVHLEQSQAVRNQPDAVRAVFDAVLPQ